MHPQIRMILSTEASLLRQFLRHGAQLRYMQIAIEDRVVTAL